MLKHGFFILLALLGKLLNANYAPLAKKKNKNRYATQPTHNGKWLK
jgi:hypothetical protein